MRPDLQWKPLSGKFESIPTLCLGIREIARVNERVDGAGWLATINQHLPFEERRHKVLSSRAKAVAAVETWADRDFEQIRADCAMPRDTGAFAGH